MDLWVKIEDFLDPDKNLPMIDMGNGYYNLNLGYTIVSRNRLAQEMLSDSALIKRITQEMMVGIQQLYEERIFSRLPAISEQYRLGGQELNYYITTNAPVGKPVLIINPEDWAKKWNPMKWASPIAWMFMEMKRHEAVEQNAKDP